MKLSDSDVFVVGEIKTESENEIIVSYPIIIRMMPNSSGTTSVATSKMMPFSKNNMVAIMKSKIVAMSKPNDKIIEYYKDFINTYGKVFDDVLEDDILGIHREDTNETTRDDTEEDNVVVLRRPTSNTSMH